MRQRKKPTPLKPCPKCGHAAKREHDLYWSMWSVCCPKCGWYGGRWMSRREADNFWNAQALKTTTPTALEKAKGIDNAQVLLDGNKTTIREYLQKEVLDTQKECGMPDWDGYGALPASKSSVDFALLYVNSFPSELLTPCVTCDNKGRISFQWGSIRHNAVILRFDDIAKRSTTLMTIKGDDIEISHYNCSIQSLNAIIKKNFKGECNGSEQYLKTARRACKNQEGCPIYRGHLFYATAEQSAAHRRGM